MMPSIIETIRRRDRPVRVIIVPSPASSELDIMEKADDHTCNVTTGSTVVLVANKHRTLATFCNDSDEVIWIKLGQDAAVSTGIRLNAAGGAFELNKTNMFKGRVSAIHGGTGNKVLCIEEVESQYAY